MPHKIFFIDIKKIKDETERNIKNKIEKIKDKKLTYLEKRFIILAQEKTTTSCVNNNNKENNYEKEDNNNSNILILNESNNTFNNVNNISYSYSQHYESTFDKTNSFTNEQIESIYDFNQKKNIDNSIQECNSMRSNFYVKYNLYHNIINNNLYYPSKYKINDKYFGLLYPNELISYGFIQSGFLTKAQNIIDSNNSNDIDFKNSKYNKILGLYFCGKNIELNIGKEIHIKICAPNEFICKECMEINKKKYNLKQNFLININGRVAKLNKGSFHCFGHFLCYNKENQIEDCIFKFSCKACKLLDEYANYYQ